MTHHEIVSSGRIYPAELLKVKENDTTDLALFFVRGMDLRPSYRLADADPSIGAAAWIVGYPGRRNGIFRETRGKIASTSFTGYRYKFDKGALQGESGGPLFVKGYKVVGVVSHSGGEMKGTLVTSLSNIKAFVTSTIGGIPKCSKPPKPPTESYPDPPIDQAPMPKPPDTAKVEAAMRTLALQNAGLKIQIALLSARLEALENKRSPALALDLLFYNSQDTLVAKGTLKNGAIKVTLPNYLVELTKADGRTAVSEQEFPFATAIRLKSEIPIEELRKALNSKGD